MKASTVLATAATLISEDRHETHGDAKLVFGLTAQFWSAYLGVTVTPTDVCQLNSLQKKARSKYGKRNDDDFIDDVGYTALASELSD